MPNRSAPQRAPFAPFAPGAPAAPAPVSLRRRLLPKALIALGVGLAGVAWLARAEDGQAPPRAERLRAAAREVAARDPQGWGGLEPLSVEELAAVRHTATAPGAIVPVSPQGLVVNGRPRARWGGVPVRATVEVRMQTASGTLLWTRTAQGGALDYPPEERALAPGPHEMALRLKPDGVSTAQAFEVATPSQVARLAAATTAVNAHAPQDLQPLLRGHAAVRLGFLLEAEACAQEALYADPKNADALELLRHVHARIGEQEGWLPRR